MMEVKILKPIKTIAIEIPQKVISTREVYSIKGADLEVEFFWNSHGNKVPFPGGPKHKKSYSKVNSDIVITETVREMYDMEFSDWKLVANGVHIQGDVSSYSYKGHSNIIRVKIIVGSG